MTAPKTLADRLRSRRDRDNMATEEWSQVIDVLESDLAVDRAALAAECERLRKEVARLEGLVSAPAKRPSARRQ